MIEITLNAGENFPLTATERYLIVRSVGDSVFLSVRNNQAVQLFTSDVIDLLETSEVNIVNKSVNAQNIKVQLSPFKTDLSASSNSIKSIDDGVRVTDMPAVQVQASVAAASGAGDVITVTLAAGETKLVLAANDKRHSASVVRGEDDLYNIKLGYKSEANAQAGMPFAPQATMTTRSQAAIYAHNHSAVTQTVIAVETTINTGA